MDDFKEILEELIKFRDERDWEQFHNSKDLAIAINSEATELLDLFLWKGNEEFDREKLKEELADVINFCLLLAHKHDLNIKEIMLEKIKSNSLKYPINKAKGSAKKYTDL